MRQRTWAFVLVGVAWVVCPAALRAQQEKEVGEFLLLLKQGMSLIQDGKPKEAVQPFEAALAKAEGAFGKNHELTSVSLLWLGRAYADQGDYPKAEPLYLRSVKIRQDKDKDAPSVASALNALAELYRVTGQYAKAEPLYLRSLTIWRAKGHPDVLIALNNLGALYHATGRYSKAEQSLRQSLKLAEGKGKENLEVAAPLNNLAELYRDMGQYDKAEPLYRRSLELKECLGKDHPEVALVLNNLALLYQAKGQHAKAEPLYLRAVRIWEGLDKGHTNVATFLNNLAEAYRATGRYADAGPLLERSLAIREARLAKDHPDIATSLNNLAALRQATGQTAKAEELLRRSLKIWEARQGLDHPDVALSLNNLAGLLAERGRTKEAASHFDRARQSSRRHVSRLLPALPPREQAAFLDVSERSRLAWSLSLALLHPEEPALARLSAGWLLNGKAVAEEALAQSALLTRDSRDPALGELASQLREARSTLAGVVLQPAPPGREKAHQQRLAQLTTRERQLARVLAAAGGASIVAADWLDLSELQKQLPADAAFIDVARIDVYDCKALRGKQWRPARYAAWVTPAKGDVKLIDLGDAAAIDAAVKEVRVALEGAYKLIRAKGEPEAEKALREPLEKLSKLVLTPLLPHVGKNKRWVVSPDGNLWLVPWEILLLQDGKYAVEKHTLSYVVSGRDLVSASRFKGKPGRPLVVADPDFDLDSKTARAEAARLLAKRDGDEETRGLSGLLRLGSIRRLPNSRAEAVAITKPLAAYAKQAPQQRLGKEALEGVVKAAKNPRVLVLSTHGFFLPSERVKPSERAGDKAEAPPGWENPLLRCGLLLAGCNDAAKVGDGDDGVLTGLEIVGMDLRGTEMVVLSACETGLGDVQQGEGVAGLRQAFRLAGADSVVGTLWQVPDRSSAQLMTLFFQNLAKGKDRATALREAQLKIIEGRREDSAAAHPFFWAAFTVTGR
jgi:CHAT domain-containing protein/tetratricopeptide (TPR) repeat protein